MRGNCGGSLSIEVSLDRSTYARTRAMQQHPLIGFAQVEHFTHFLGQKAFDVAQRDHFALRWRQALERR